MEAKIFLLAGILLLVPLVLGLGGEALEQHTEPIEAMDETANADSLAGCMLADQPPARDEATCAPSPESPEEGTRFILTGDTGTGGEAQERVAGVMEDVCADHGCDFVIIAGDNIYETGVTSAHDPQFATKFEEPYKNLDVPFYLTPGNHDSAGGPTIAGEHLVLDTGYGAWHESADHEVAYTYRDDRSTSLLYDGSQPSAKWTMPARWYTFTVDDDLAQFFSLDANAIMWWGDSLFIQDPLALKQEAWLQDELAASQATWKLVFGHQPYISNGQHGNAGEYNDQFEHQEVGSNTLGVYLKRFIEDNVCGKADYYLSGHDHDLQWLEPEHEECGSDTEFIVSGAGGKNRDITDETRNPVYFQKGDTYGFFHIELVDTTMTATVYDDAGDELFTRTWTK